MKIRLHGTQKENEDFIEELEKVETIKILSVSKPYLDRGRSVFERVYIDCNLVDKVQMLKNAIAGETVFYFGKQAMFQCRELTNLVHNLHRLFFLCLKYRPFLVV